MSDPRKKRKKSDFKFSDADVEFFDLGTAELEQGHLDKVYIDNPFLEEALRFSSLKTFFIARTGVGKSAIIERVKSSFKPRFVIQIDPESFIPTLLRTAEFLGVVQRAGISIEYFLKTLWRFIIVVELLKRRHGSARKGFMDRFMQKDDVSSRAYKFLERHKVLDGELSIGDRVISFVNDLTKGMEARLNAMGVSLEISRKHFDHKESEVIKQVLREFEFPEINQLVKELDLMLDGESFFVLIDDLDKAWVESGLGVSLIQSLFLTMAELAPLKSVKAIVSLRMNLFSQLRFAQPEKIRPLISHLVWTDNDLKKMLDKRFEYRFGIDTNYVWQNIFPHRIHAESGETSIHRYLMRMCNRKPRDLFFLIASAMKYAKGKNRISQDAFRKCQNEFSEDRLANLIAEWASPFSGLQELLAYFQGQQAEMTGKDLRAIIDNMIIHASDAIKAGSSQYEWMIKGGLVTMDEAKFGESSGLFRFLYRIGVVGFQEKATHKVHFVFDYGDTGGMLVLEDDLRIFINPAFAWALTKMNVVYRTAPDVVSNDHDQPE